MSLSLSILASGSSGNCSVVRTSAGAMLIDCGIGPRVSAARMKSLGISIAQITAICLTHLDHDHFRPSWAGEIVRRGIRVHCHRGKIEQLARRVGDPDFSDLLEPFDAAPFSPIDGVVSTPVHLAHDELGSHGFVLECSGVRLGYATDLGRVTAEMIRSFIDLDLLAIESNYDPQMQRQSPRPWFLKQRIMGGRGHLSNEQARSAVVRILDGSAPTRLPRHIVLLHRSRECNCPRIVRELFMGDRRIAGRLVLAEQDRATHWMNAQPREQLVGAQLELQWS